MFNTEKLRQRLSVIFAAAVLGPAAFVAGTTGPAQAAPSGPPKAPSTPSVLQVFGINAAELPTSKNPYGWMYNSMIDKQEKIMQADGPRADAYEAYLRTFDRYRGQPLEEMARDVNARVLSTIGYEKDSTQYGYNYYAPPAQTWSNGRGDCDDYASIMLDVMHYLGVPKDRLYTAGVTTPSGSLHVVAMVDVSKKKNGSRMIKMDMVYAPYVRNIEEDSSYSVYAVYNEFGYWRIPTALEKLYINNPYKKKGQTPHIHHFKGQHWDIHIKQTKDKRTAFVANLWKKGPDTYSVEFISPKVLVNRVEDAPKLPNKLRRALIYLNAKHMPPAPGQKGYSKPKPAAKLSS